jgi:hypothetical protein
MLSRTAEKIRRQITQFSGNLSVGLSKPLRRFVGEMIYGIQAKKSVHLTEIGRSLGESIPLAKTENRLSRNLLHTELRPALQAAILREGSCRIEPESLLVLDLSDIVKPYAKKMEHLAPVHDGSAGGVGKGYWLCEVIGVENEGSEITPLYSDLYSQKAPDFVSENAEILRAVRRVSTAVSGRGIWVIDRGGDRGELYDEFVPSASGLKFLIRQRGDRHLLVGSRKLSTLEAARSCVLPFRETIIDEEAGRERVVHLEFGYRPVRLVSHPEESLSLVVVRGFGSEPMMLLTNVSLRRSRKRVWWALQAYLTRWRIEETIRFAKQSYAVEDVRVQRYERLRNVVVLVLAAMYFTAAVLGRKMKLKILAGHVLKAAKRLFGIPDFRYYALADGICEICREFPRRAGQSATPGTDELPLFSSA